MDDLNFINCLEKLFNFNLENDFIFIKDYNLNYIYANNKFLDLFKVELKDILGKNDSFFIEDPTVLEQCKISDLQVLKEGFILTSETVYEQEFEVLKFKINLSCTSLGILSWAKTK